MSEHSQLQSQVIEYLNYIPGCFAYETSTTGGKGAPRKSKSKGKSDIACCYQGMYIAIEIKILPDTQSGDQEDFEKLVLGSGGRYWIITSLHEIQLKMKTLIADMLFGKL